MNLVQGQYKHNLQKLDGEKELFIIRVKKAELAKDSGDIERVATFAMVNDTIYFVESTSITALGSVSVFLWNKGNDRKKGNNVIIRSHEKKEKCILLKEQYQLQFEYIAKSVDDTYFNHYPLLKEKIEIWDIPFLTAIKRSPKVKNEMSRYVVRVIIQNGNITSCEWIIIETLYKPDASYIIE
ncbi:MAG: hypothetical protein J5565_02600 [Muribaculaceae bacterium]|nr:hypothetical protein [Muribaculaceae bacterium]